MSAKNQGLCQGQPLGFAKSRGISVVIIIIIIIIIIILLLFSFYFIPHFFQEQNTTHVLLLQLLYFSLSLSCLNNNNNSACLFLFFLLNYHRQLLATVALPFGLVWKPYHHHWTHLFFLFKNHPLISISVMFQKPQPSPSLLLSGHREPPLEKLNTPSSSLWCPQQNP